MNRYSRNSKRYLIVTFIIFTIIFLFTWGCSKTHLVNLWEDPYYEVQPMNKILVIAAQEDDILRRTWEDAFVGAINTDKSITEAISSYSMFPGGITDTTALKEKIRADGYDGVLVLVRAQREERTYELPGYMTNEEITVCNPAWGTCVTRRENVYHHGDTVTDTTFQIRTDLLLTQEGGRLLWSAKSETVDPASPLQLRNSVADLVVSELHKADFIR
jgi:hypothetical protein